MTRINVIQPPELHRVHLVAEYKEITQFLHLVNKRKSTNNFNDIPAEYTLGQGHCKFFYDKGKFIYDRFLTLATEMDKRGISIDYDAFNERADKIEATYTGNLWRDYEPTPEAIALCRERIAQRIAEKPHLYT